MHRAAARDSKRAASKGLPQSNRVQGVQDQSIRPWSVIGWLLAVIGTLATMGGAVGLASMPSQADWAVAVKGLLAPYVNLSPAAVPWVMMGGLSVVSMLVLALGILCIDKGRHGNGCGYGNAGHPDEPSPTSCWALLCAPFSCCKPDPVLGQLNAIEQQRQAELKASHYNSRT